MGTASSEEPRRRVCREVLLRSRELRHPLTPAEAKLWQRLCNRQAGGLKFRRQYAIYRFIVDFYCPETRLAIEVDGDVHDGQQEYDAARTEWLEGRGYRLVRFANDQVLTNVESVVESIVAAAGTARPSSPALLPASEKGADPDRSTPSP